MIEADWDQLVTGSPSLSAEEEDELFLLRRDFDIEPEDAYERRPAWAMDLLARYRREEIEMLNAAHDSSGSPAPARAARVSEDDWAGVDQLLEGDD